MVRPETFGPYCVVASRPPLEVFSRIWYFEHFSNIFWENSNFIKSDNNNEQFTHEDQYEFLIILRQILLRVRNISVKSCRKNQNRLSYVQYFFFFFENRTVYEITWKYIVQPGRPQMAVQYGACALHAAYPRLQTHTQNM